MSEQQVLNKGRIAISLAVIASLFPSLAILYFWRVQANPPQATTTETVAEAPVVRNVTSLGRVEPKGEVIEISGTSGSRISQLLVSEGQQVKEGQILAYLENYGEKLAEKNLAASQLAEATFRYDSVTKYGDAQIQEAMTRIEQIKQPQSFEIKAQEAQVKQLSAEEASARKDYERNKFLKEQGAVSGQVLDEYAVAYFSKKAELENAQAVLEQFTATRSQDLKNAEAQLASAQASLAQTQSEIEVKSAQDNLELAKARLELTMIRAPRSGRVLDIVAHSGEVIDEEGILQLGDTEQMYVVAEVYESDIGKIKLGQKAIISDSSLPRSIQGTVAQISSQISKNDVLDNDPAADTERAVYIGGFFWF